LHCLVPQTSLRQKKTMKRYQLLLTFSCASLALIGCSNNAETEEDIAEIRQYIKGAVRTDINDIKDRLDTLEAGGPALAGEDGSIDATILMDRIQLVEEQLTQAVEDIQQKNVKIMDLENTVARLQGISAPSPSVSTPPAAPTVPSVPAAPPSPPAPVVDDSLFDSKVVQQYREQYPSSASLTNRHITHLLGMNFEAREQLNQLYQVDPTFEQKYRLAKELAAQN